jgi:hypothetical protein
MENDYYSKYLKYKSKYLELKKQLGGADNCNGLDKFVCYTTPYCTYNYPLQDNNILDKEKGCRRKECNEYTNIFTCSSNQRCAFINKQCKDKSSINCDEYKKDNLGCNTNSNCIFKENVCRSKECSDYTNKKVCDTNTDKCKNDYSNIIDKKGKNIQKWKACISKQITS